MFAQSTPPPGVPALEDPRSRPCWLNRWFKNAKRINRVAFCSARSEQKVLAGAEGRGASDSGGGGAARGQARGPPPGDTGPALSPRTAAFPLPAVLGSVVWTQVHQEPHSVT